jgi:hypothetical protein
MSKFLFAALFAAIGVGTASATNPLNQGIKNASAAAATAMHKAHLELALKDILIAEADAKAGKFASAEKAAASAMRQIHEAVAHHQYHAHLYQYHHTHLHNALRDLQAAEKQLKTGSVGNAEHDLAKAAAQVRDSLAAHHHHNTLQTKTTVLTK